MQASREIHNVEVPSLCDSRVNIVYGFVGYQSSTNNQSRVHIQCHSCDPVYTSCTHSQGDMQGSFTELTHTSTHETKVCLQHQQSCFSSATALAFFIIQQYYRELPLIRTFQMPHFRHDDI